MDETIKRINFLYNKSKTEGLTPEEAEEQQKLRKEYVEAFKKSMRAQLDNTYIVEPDGTKRKCKPKN